MPQGSSSAKVRPILEKPNVSLVNSNTSPKTKVNPTENGEVVAKQINLNNDRPYPKAGAMNKSELSDFVSSAREKGFTPSKLAKICHQIDSLQKKYGMNYDELKSTFEETSRALEAKNIEIKKLNAEIAAAIKKKNDLMQQYYLDEKQVQDYVDARDGLLSIGFDIGKLSEVKSSLLAMKKEDYNLKVILEKLKTIGDIESRKSTLQNELNALNGEMRAKKTLLVELNKLQDTGLTVEQVERIRDVVSRISSTHGINSDQSFERFEQDVLKHYNAALGLETEISFLQESKEAINRENELKRKAVEQAEKELSLKTKKLEESYASQKEELKAFSELRANGVDGSTIMAWQELIRSAKVDPAALSSEIQRLGSLSSLEEQTKSRIKELEEKQNALESALGELNQKKEAIELSIGTVKDSSINQIEQTSSRALSSIAEITKEAGQVTEKAKEDLAATLEQVRSSATLFSNELKEAFKDVGPQLKNVAQAVEAARAIGKYEAILPLFKLTEGSQSSKITETEALVAMWNITNAFNSWLKGHYPNEELEISEPLEKMVQALDGEIHGLGREEEESADTETDAKDESDESNES
ncbi:MAG: hypothetical protein PXY39_14990 [archaeon]|nr:hypothetical protein [archaeon]